MRLLRGSIYLLILEPLSHQEGRASRVTAHGMVLWLRSCLQMAASWRTLTSSKVSYK